MGQCICSGETALSAVIGEPDAAVLFLFIPVIIHNISCLLRKKSAMSFSSEPPILQSGNNSVVRVGAEQTDDSYIRLHLRIKHAVYTFVGR